MSQAGVGMTSDWRERYLKLADQHERATRSHAEAERELTRLVTRLCVACSGLDPVLDPHLRRLRQAAKGGDARKLLRQAGDFADSVVRASDGRSPARTLEVLLARSTAGRRQIDEAVETWNAVARDPASAPDDQLDRLADLLRLCIGGTSSKQADPRPGLLGRLIGKPGAPGVEPDRLLLELLQSIAWPDAMAARIEAFSETLQSDSVGDAWIDVVREISELALGALNQSQDDARSAEEFLNQLNRRLEEIDRHMLDEVQRREDSRESSERLGHEMDAEVVSLTASVRDSVNLSQLQANVIGSLDRIQAHVRHHLQEEGTRREKAEAESEHLRGELHQLEQETFDLRRQVAQTYHEAMRDALTGLPNRRAYDERINQEYARWKRFGEALALLVLDVDDFKRVNDTFGHKSGDKALAMIAKILGERVRETDFIARYGGEEFVVLLTGADRSDVLRIAEAMRRAVEGGGLHAKQRPVTITVSCGFAMFNEGDIPESVFERADKALYLAKSKGKNCVVAG